jgi:IPT/TIG domain
MRKLRRRRKRMAVLAAGTALMPVGSALASLLGNQLFPANNPWNQPITNAPVATNSAAIIANIGTSAQLFPDWDVDNPANGASLLYGIPYNVVHGNSTAKVNVVIDNYPDESDLLPVPIPANAVLEGDFQNGPSPSPSSNGDAHLIVWDEDNNVGYELWYVSRPSENPDGKWHAASETVWNFGTNSFRPLGFASADGAGLPILSGLARPDEALPVLQGGQGVINHALRATLPNRVIDSRYIYPASHVASGTHVSTNTIPLGSRLRLKNTPAVNNAINLMGPQSQAVARAMQQYGLIVADLGGSIAAIRVTGASGSVNANNNLSLTWDMTDIMQLKGLTADSFEVVNLTPIVTSLSATQGSPGSNLTITGQNFSGAAGRLSVFFGTNAASSVNVLSDSQISVSVPSGSGTVDVTVQSGVKQTSTGNATAPIFGYGTSALTAADKFTFTPPPPTIQHVAKSAGNIIMTGTNNAGPGGTYHVLTSTNLLLPRTNWTVLTNASFDSSGNFSFTNAIANTSTQQFYILQVP